jgi:hypothetical protein
MDTNEGSKEDYVIMGEQEPKSRKDSDRATLITFLLNEIQSQDEGSRQLITYNFVASFGYIYAIINYRDQVVHYGQIIVLLFIFTPIFSFLFSMVLAVRNLRPSIDKSTVYEGISPEYLLHLVEDKNREFRRACQLVAIGFGIILMEFACYFFISK